MKIYLAGIPEYQMSEHLIDGTGLIPRTLPFAFPQIRCHAGGGTKEKSKKPYSLVTTHLA